jgi:hypothetical protein
LPSVHRTGDAARFPVTGCLQGFQGFGVAGDFKNTLASPENFSQLPEIGL